MGRVSASHKRFERQLRLLAADTDRVAARVVRTTRARYRRRRDHGWREGTTLRTALRPAGQANGPADHLLGRPADEVPAQAGALRPSPWHGHAGGRRHTGCHRGPTYL